MPIDLQEICKALSLDLVAQPSVTGTVGEANFGPWLVDYLRDWSSQYALDAEVWSFPVGPDDPRRVVALLLRGSGARTVVLTGHYDTVTVDDYGDFAPLAGDPERLRDALLVRLADATSAAAQRARDDLTSRAFLPGRGLLDMKGGLAAGLSALASIGRAGFAGNLLFLAVPDEEKASAGARAAAAELPGLASARGLQVAAVINLDAIADDGDGSAGRVLATGTVGKVLPTALVVGRPVHSGFALRGLNAAVLAGAIAARLEWAPELTDDSGGVPGTPASLLALKDGKTGYDVTTPGTAWMFWNVLLHQRDPAGVLREVVRLVREAVAESLAGLARRAGQSALAADAAALESEVPVMTFAGLLRDVAARDPGVHGFLHQVARDAAEADLPERCRRVTVALWERSGRAGPAVVLGLGSMPYLATGITDEAVLGRLRSFLADAPARHGVTLSETAYFAGISDMSFFGQADDRVLSELAAETPVWEQAVKLGPGALAQVPTVNLGPWGRDYHTPWERTHVDYAFRVLPALVEDLARRLLAD